MIDDIGATEAEARDEVDLSQGDAKAIGPTKRQEEAEPMAHNDGVAQWAADGHITAVGHGSQEHTFCAHECNEEVKLYHTVREGDAAAHGPKTKQHRGYSDREVPGLREGQLGQEEVHGLVQRPVLLHQQDDDHLFSHCQNTGHEEHEEHCCTHTPVPRKRHQNEPGDPCLVLHFHIGDTGLNSPGGKKSLGQNSIFGFSD